MSLVIQTTQLFQLIWALRGSFQISLIAIHGTFAWRHPTRMERMAIQQPRHQPLDFDLRVIVRRWKFWSGTRAIKATSKFNRNHLWSFNECVVVFFGSNEDFLHQISNVCPRNSSSQNEWIGPTFFRCERFGRISSDRNWCTVYVYIYNWILEQIPVQWRKYMEIQLITHIELNRTEIYGCFCSDDFGVDVILVDGLSKSEKEKKTTESMYKTLQIIG